VLVEAAIILPLLFLLIFGVMEIGSMLKAYSGANNAVRAAGRMASVAGNDADADLSIMERMATEASGLKASEIEYVVVWHATAVGDEPPAACRPAVQASPNSTSIGVSDGGTDALGACNIYHRPALPGGAFDMAQGQAGNPASYYFGCSGSSDPDAGHKVDCNWPGRNRQVTTTPRGVTPVERPDYLGVYIRSEHTAITGVLGTTFTITDSGVNLLEPQGYSIAA
jgi:hypothetical protein